MSVTEFAARAESLLTTTPLQPLRFSTVSDEAPNASPDWLSSRLVPELLTLETAQLVPPKAPRLVLSSPMVNLSLANVIGLVHEIGACILL